jgi:tetratricopeptide (TPR) repeat protein
VGLLVVAAAVWWACLLHQAEGSVFARVPILDEIYYLDRAAEVAAGTGQDQPYFISPLYPRLAALAGAGTFDPDLRVVPAATLRGLRVFQIGCWLGVLLLLRLLAGRFLAPLTAAGWKRQLVVWLPVVLFATYRPAAVYGLSILVELPLLLLLTSSLYLILDLAAADGPRGRDRVARTLLLGVALGLAGLLRGSALMIVPVAVAAAALRQPAWRGRLVAGALVAAGTLVAVAPAVVHNSRLTGRPAGPTLNAGVNLYIGNGPEANGFYVAAVPGDWRRDPAGRSYLAARRNLPEVSLAAADRIWREQALAEMKSRPGRTAGLWLKKVWLHLQGWEIDQLAPLDGWARAVPLLRVLAAPYAVIVILGLTGLIAFMRRDAVRWLGLVLGTLIAVQSLFFVVSRYRLALVPCLVLLAGAGLAALLNRRPRTWPVVAVCVLLVLPWGLGETRQTWRSLALANEGLRWGEIAAAEDSPAARDRAVDLYRQAVAGPVVGPAPWLGLAALLVETGELDEAAAVLAAGAAANPGHLETAKALVAAYLAADRLAEASTWMQRILARSPDDADTLHNTAVLLGGTGNLPEAMAAASRLIAAHPADPRGYSDLGILLARSGRTDEARAVFTRGLAAVPGHPGLQKNLSLLKTP